MEELRFVCDAMLGRLARWLRLAGFDTLYEPDAADGELAALARAGERWLLTRDRRLASRAGPRVVLVRAAGVREQLAEVCDRLPVRRASPRFFTRCPRCNGLLQAVPREAVAQRVPPFVVAHATTFRQCPGCGQVYWPGTHVPRIEARLAAFFVEVAPSGGGQHEAHRRAAPGHADHQGGGGDASR